MKTKFQIYCDYLKAINLAKNIEVIASMSREVAYDKIHSHIHNLSSCWEGQAKGLYCKKLLDTSGDIKQSADNLKKIAVTIRQIAARNYSSELKALEIAKKREY